MPYTGGYLYGRKRTMRLPVDAATADIVQRRLRLEQRDRTVWTPISVTLSLAAFAVLYLADNDNLPYVLSLVFFVASASLSLWTTRLSERLAIAQQPELVGRLGVYLPAVSPPVAQEWMTHNPAVQAVPERPRWRRYPTWVYRWAAVASAIAGVGVWWAALRNGTFNLTTLLAFLLLISATAVFGFKALPIGFIRRDDAT